jgi:hypothetical protein
MSLIDLHLSIMEFFVTVFLLDEHVLFTLSLAPLSAHSFTMAKSQFRH